MGDTVGPRYTAPKISAISYLFRTFSLLIMGDTKRPHYTGFRGLSVRGIMALQCTMKRNSTPSHKGSCMLSELFKVHTVDSRYLDFGYLE